MHPAHDVEPSEQPSDSGVIKVTPEMIAAGTAELARFNEEYDRPSDAVVWIYEAMEEVRRRANPESL
jgi:hypothetical protein